MCPPVSVCLSIYLSVCLCSVYNQPVVTSLCQCIFQSGCLSVRVSFSQDVSLSVRLSAQCLCVRPGPRSLTRAGGVQRQPLHPPAALLALLVTDLPLRPLVAEHLHLADRAVHQPVAMTTHGIGVHLQVEGEAPHALLGGEVCTQTVDRDEDLEEEEEEREEEEGEEARGGEGWEWEREKWRRGGD